MQLWSELVQCHSIPVVLWWLMVVDRDENSGFTSSRRFLACPKVCCVHPAHNLLLPLQEEAVMKAWQGDATGNNESRRTESNAALETNNDGCVSSGLQHSSACWLRGQWPPHSSRKVSPKRPLLELGLFATHWNRFKLFHFRGWTCLGYIFLSSWTQRLFAPERLNARKNWIAIEEK